MLSWFEPKSGSNVREVVAKIYCLYSKRNFSYRFNIHHMTHPFAKMFTTALKESTPMNNLVLEEAERLKEKGYRPEEIHTVLTKLYKGRIDETEREILAEVVEEFENYL